MFDEVFVRYVRDLFTNLQRTVCLYTTRFNIRAVHSSHRVCQRFLCMLHLATPSFAEYYVALVVDKCKRRREESVTMSLPEPWYGFCVFLRNLVQTEIIPVYNTD